MNDQCRLNFALKNMGLEWSKLLDDKTMIGGDRNGLKVIVLPQMNICHHVCITNSTQDFYYSQAFGGTVARKGAWFLRRDCSLLHVKSLLTGTEWLKFLSTCHSVMLSNTWCLSSNYVTCDEVQTFCNFTLLCSLFFHSYRKSHQHACRWIGRGKYNPSVKLHKLACTARKKIFKNLRMLHAQKTWIAEVCSLVLTWSS